MKRILRKLTVKSTSLEVYISKFFVGLLSGLIGVFVIQNLEQVPESITIDCKLMHKPCFQTLRVDRWGGVTASFIRHTLQRLETVSAISVGLFPFRVSNFGSKVFNASTNEKKNLNQTAVKQLRLSTGEWIRLDEPAQALHLDAYYYKTGDYELWTSSLV